LKWTGDLADAIVGSDARGILVSPTDKAQQGNESDGKGQVPAPRLTLGDKPAKPNNSANDFYLNISFYLLFNLFL